MKKIALDIEKEIINLYIKGNSCKNISKIINLSNTTVFNVLKRNNIKTRTRGGIENISNELIYKMYEQDKLTLNDIAKHFNVNLETIRQRLIKLDCKRRNVMENYNPNIIYNCFNIIDTEWKAYFLGFLITDGCITKVDKKNNKPNQIVILSLQNKDSYILERFREVIHASNNLIADKRGCTTLSINSQEMVNDLSKYGVICNKTWKTFLPNVSENMYPHLIRGLIDGDGWMTNHIKSNGKKGIGIGLCGNKDLILQTKQYLCDLLNLYPIKPQIKNKLYSVLWGSKKDIIAIGDYIYHNATFYLTRKYNIYKSIKNS